MVFLTLALVVTCGCSDGEPDGTLAEMCPGLDTAPATVGEDDVVGALGEGGALLVEVKVDANGDAFLFDDRGDCYQSQPTDQAPGTYTTTGRRGSGVPIIVTMPDGTVLGFTKVLNG